MNKTDLFSVLVRIFGWVKTVILFVWSALERAMQPTFETVQNVVSTIKIYEAIPAYSVQNVIISINDKAVASIEKLGTNSQSRASIIEYTHASYEDEVDVQISGILVLMSDNNQVIEFCINKNVVLDATTVIKLSKSDVDYLKL